MLVHACLPVVLQVCHPVIVHPGGGYGDYKQPCRRSLLKLGPLLSLSEIRSRAAMINYFGRHLALKPVVQFQKCKQLIRSRLLVLNPVLMLLSICGLFAPRLQGQPRFPIDFVMSCVFGAVNESAPKMQPAFNALSENTPKTQDVIESLGETMGNSHETHGYSVLHLHCSQTTTQQCESDLTIFLPPINILCKLPNPFPSHFYSTPHK